MESGRSRSAYGFFTFHLPRPASGPAPFHLSSGPVLRVLLGIGGGLRITTDDDASSPNRLNQRPEKKERRAWEIFNAEKFFGSAELTSRALQKAT